MVTRFAIAALVFLLSQAVLFGIGVTAVLATSLAAEAGELLPMVIVVSAVLALGIAWWFAPLLDGDSWQQRPRHVPVNRVVAELS